VDGRLFAYPPSDFGLLFRSNSRTADAKMAMLAMPCGARGVADDVNGFCLERARWDSVFVGG